jgi:hypothetical protein
LFGQENSWSSSGGIETIQYFMWYCMSFLICTSICLAEDSSRTHEQVAKDFLAEIPTLVENKKSLLSKSRGYFAIRGDRVVFGREIIAVAFTAVEVRQEVEAHCPTSLAVYRQDQMGRWEVASTEPIEDCSSLIDGSCKFMDITGDGIPELLLTESWGTTGNTSVRALKFVKDTGEFKTICSDLSRPTWDGTELIEYSKGGNAGLDCSTSSSVWRGDKLVRKWESRQSHKFSEATDSDSIVLIEYRKFDEEGRVQDRFAAAGNLQSFRNVIGDGQSPEPIVVYYQSERRPQGRTIKVLPDWKKIGESTFDIVSALSKAIYEDPDSFCNKSMITVGSRAAEIGECAIVEIAEGAADDMKAHAAFVKKRIADEE